MHFFITGTDTNIGKTLISTWLSLHTRYDYFKPIQTGTIGDMDSEFVAQYSNVKVHKELYKYKEPLSPHRAAFLENSSIELDKIILPKVPNLIIEGAGGVLVPINEKFYMIDIIKQLKTSTILVARSGLGTLNHSLLTIEALRARNIDIAGVILNGTPNAENAEAIECYGKVKILAQFPKLEKVSKENLLNITFADSLKKLFNRG